MCCSGCRYVITDIANKLQQLQAPPSSGGSPQEVSTLVTCRGICTHQQLVGLLSRASLTSLVCSPGESTVSTVYASMLLALESVFCCLLRLLCVSMYSYWEPVCHAGLSLMCCHCMHVTGNPAGSGLGSRGCSCPAPAAEGTCPRQQQWRRRCTLQQLPPRCASTAGRPVAA